MKWEQQKQDNGGYCLNVEADWSEISEDYDDIVSRYSKVQVPGFRPGKAPRNIIEKRFQKEIINDLSYQSAQRISRKVFREAGIEFLGNVEAQDIDCGKDRPFKARFNFQPVPKIDLPELDSLKIDSGDIDPRDQISLWLLKQVDFDVPEKLIKDELIIEGAGEALPDSRQWTEISDRIKLMLILKKIAHQEGIEIDDADVNERIAQKAEEFGATKQSLQTELEKGGGVQRLKDMLLAESTLDYLIEKSS